ncbi:MAG: lipoate--protein ligase family protein [Limisphaerales bacterium]
MNWLLLNSGKCDARFNMALDEALLENISQLAKPVLRFYGWTEPAATFGYFQKFSEVERATHLRPLIRRPTGGGIVPHDLDWTYSFVVPPNHDWYLFKAIESYRRIHEWIQSAFTKLKIETELALCCKKSAPGECFAGHEKFDLLWHKKKVAGAAQRRNKFGLLIQGSIQPPPFQKSAAGSQRPDWENAMRDVAREKWKVEWKEFLPDENLQRRAEALARQKYSQNNYNQKR